MKHIAVFLLFIMILSACTPVKRQKVKSQAPDIRVLLAEINQRDSLAFNGTFKLHSEEADYEFGQQNQHLYLVPSKKGILLYNDNRYLEYLRSTKIVLEPAADESHFLYHDSEYSGNIVIEHKEDSTFFLINVLSLEDYLRGVVPAEIPVSETKNFEAVKAQAICARTYSLNKMAEMKEKNFDVVSDVRDQVYSGVSAHHPWADKAIHETRGIILTYQGNPATVYYHSTCGGRLEAVEDVFADHSLTYLSGGFDAVSDIFSCSASPRFRWVETRTINQLDSTFDYFYHRSSITNSLTDGDTIHLQLDMDILKRTESGRVKQMKLQYADTTVLLQDFEIRRFFGWPPGESLNSNLFYISQLNDSTITLNGGGYGHGVGMCQWGAMNMSAKGFRYYHILNKYFPGTLLSRGY